MKSNPTQKCRPAKGMSKRVKIEIIKDNRYNRKVCMNSQELPPFQNVIVNRYK
jgi:hypothetical protein